MVVAYDARCLHPAGRHWGVGVVVSNIVQRLSGKLELIGLAPRSTAGAPENIRYWPSPVRKLDLLTFEFSPGFAGSYDLYWGTNHLLPQLVRGKRLLTVHDVLLFKFPGDQNWSRYLRGRFASSLARADRIATDSRTTADDLVALFPSVAKKTEVIHCGFDVPVSNGVPASSKTDDPPYVVILGAHRPRKNLDLALAAVAAARERVHSLRSVVTGEIHESFRKSLLDAAAYTDILGTVPKEKLFTLLSGATALLFPSVYEGFGFPLLEAMAAGCPVIALDTTINREIAGTAATFLGNSVTNWASAIQRLLADSSFRSDAQHKGFENLRRFDWGKSAAHYLEIMQECAA